MSSAVATSTNKHFVSKARSAAHTKLFAAAVVPDVIDDDVETVIEYPEIEGARKTHLSTKTGRPVTEFQYRVYDACRQIPAGHFSTYKAIADHLSSGPRAVGNALAMNPFAPLPIPCHRVLTSDCYIGGFSGDKKSKIFWKKAKLEKEGLSFDDSGYVTPKHQQMQFFDGFK
ncbi:hypothetical protein IW140_000656 [Coemansia sp. RSA 1813]|nr:hypothetical protein EV178_000838 [Coemansia sp. RSA 1646]KAJ1773835.1 hypothetical protein LPJ74_000379 [Coemansia sp. RSA 1843]KAJ2092459.1 hypothetical protein IW138_001221 [Coemansia sp. RSA 986]KAJ2217317.1 hypothetical protein EV179_000467 [Coemansia sp. RSA 487]KAJ2572541.1 hypothetical protein IW140_000656 [Coemansia sp. RSA 1813]